MLKSQNIVTYALGLLTRYMPWYCTMLCNFRSCIWYSYVFHNVRVLHHVMQFLNDRLFKKDDVTQHDLTDLTNMGSSRDPPNLKRAFSQNYYSLSVTLGLNNNK